LVSGKIIANDHGDRFRKKRGEGLGGEVILVRGHFKTYRRRGKVVFRGRERNSKKGGEFPGEKGEKNRLNPK